MAKTFAEGQLDDHLTRIAASLRRLADKVDRYADVEKEPYDAPTRARYAAHDILWGLANMHLDDLIADACLVAVDATTNAVAALKAAEEKEKPCTT